MSDSFISYSFVKNNYGPFGMEPLEERTIELLRKQLGKGSFQFVKSGLVIVQVIDTDQLLSVFSSLGDPIMLSGTTFLIVKKNKSCIYFNINRYSDHARLEWVTHVNKQEDMEDVCTAVSNVLKDLEITHHVIAGVKWYHNTVKGIKKAEITEFLGDTFHKEAYPFLGNVDQVISDYLESSEKVIVLKGPPGTGKTRFIRHLMRTIGLARRNYVHASFTSDTAVLHSDEMFVEFMESGDQVLILEDIDFNLAPRKDGNTSMYHLLTISDSILSNARFKVVVSTNLSCVKDIDPALLRPGRCFQVLEFRELTIAESKKLLAAMGKKLPKEVLSRKSLSLAEIYRIASGRATTAPEQKTFGLMAQLPS